MPIKKIGILGLQYFLGLRFRSLLSNFEEPSECMGIHDYVITYFKS